MANTVHPNQSNIIGEKPGLCDSCDEPGGEQEYVGYGMMFCQKCIAKHLVRIPSLESGHPGFRFKNSKEMVYNTNERKR